MVAKATTFVGSGGCWGMLYSSSNWCKSTTQGSHFHVKKIYFKWHAKNKGWNLLEIHIIYGLFECK
jgi:hypothetical protein